jgi:hypothetical protein
MFTSTIVAAIRDRGSDLSSAPEEAPEESPIIDSGKISSELWF